MVSSGTRSTSSKAAENSYPQDPFSQAVAYSIDAMQRSLLFCDVMRQRTEQHETQSALEVPHVLDYECELVINGRDLERPVNYGLVRIRAPEGTEIDERKRPFVVIDPRAGHGPGIGGFKSDSEIGVAMKAGHPCYFIGFTPFPEPGQTIFDIAEAEAVFLRKVIELHPDAPGRPCVIGNCQAGWAAMIVAALNPDLFGPIIIAGAPLSYWAGVHGRNPMRYSGGLLGGSWLTALTSDLGNGIFDGAWLVKNFEAQNPANTLWSKQYNLYSRVDTEGPRYLGFERWWGEKILLNGEEMQTIVDDLFVGNRLSSGEMRTPDGRAIDLRNIRSPVVVFCSKGDNITPPQQALDWVLDLYEDVDDIRKHQQTIVYTIHESIGHLGIFVSAGVARKQHDEFVHNIDMINILPPGLYEAIFEPVDETTANADLVAGNWVMRCEARSFDDLRALGGNTIEDDRCFDAADRLSRTNLAFYRTFIQPWVRSLASEQAAELLRQTHPLRMQYMATPVHRMFHGMLERAAERVRENRKPVEDGNLFSQMERQISGSIVDGLEAWRQATETMAEKTFFAIFGNPVLQSSLGVDQGSGERPRKAAKSAQHQRLIDAEIASLKERMSEGGMLEAFIRSLLYVALAERKVDERAFSFMRHLWLQQRRSSNLDIEGFRKLVREQFFMLSIDEEAATAAIAGMLSSDPGEREAAFEAIEQVVEAGAGLEEHGKERLARIARMFTDDEGTDSPPAATGERRRRRQVRAKGSTSAGDGETLATPDNGSEKA
ncbi:MAG: DUF3141 domain-containing protein [Geminicoccaceae bacterium]|nr:DUF3141 domain-containing protein [Geminicoccaceae bacterium]